MELKKLIRLIRYSVLSPVVFVLVWDLPAMAQNVEYYKDADVTEEKLIDSLTPKGAVQTRGRRLRALQVVPAKTDKAAKTETTAKVAVKAKASCQSFRTAIAKGNKTGSVADVVAMNIEFDVNSAKISQASTRKLEVLAKALESEELKNYCFEVQGHTDSTGASRYNLKLSKRRANSVAKFLASNYGVEADRLLASGHGESAPIADNETGKGRQRNRRVQIINLGEGQ